ncbi:MAG: hypothetical protein IJS12_09200 [Lachnospiraceae bacterium]|nr:hypothetical protein [Lachnospiraceae bacterium]
MLKKLLKKSIFALFPVLAFCYMIFVFGPTEVFFVNHSEFEFIFKEFFGLMVTVCLIVTLIFTFLLALLPEKIMRILCAVISAVDVAGYIQVMFLNKNLDLLGQNPDGYKADPHASVTGLIVWLALIALMVVVAIVPRNTSVHKIIPGIPAFLLAIQLVAIVSLITGGEETCFERDPGEWYMSGEKQMMVSEGDNVMVFILDYFSNTYIDTMLAEYPGALDYLHDFTYYDNDECVYMGTIPSIAHMLSGSEVDASQPMDEWFHDIWFTEKASKFFETVHSHDYEINVYTPDGKILRGNNDVRILEGMFDNLTNQGQEPVIDKKLMISTMSKCSSYRFAPEILKPMFYTGYEEYVNIVKYKNTNREHTLFDFYDRMMRDGVTVDPDSRHNLCAIQHLNGAHSWDVGADCRQKDNATLAETCMGNMTLMEEYLNQLKAIDKYDDSTIIITSDHGSDEEPQVIFFIKYPGETHDQMQVNHAPISHCELLPTIVQAVGGDSSYFGPRIDEIPEDEPRARSYYWHTEDMAYPKVMNIFTGSQAYMNVYYRFDYTGDFDDLRESIASGPDEIIPMYDSDN